MIVTGRLKTLKPSDRVGQLYYILHTVVLFCHPIHLKYVTLIPPLNVLQILDVYTLEVCHKHKGNNGSVL